MSALTDLFTAMANKIRSKTGGSDTYTPAEMVSDGIDDVYDAGVAAGTTPTQTKSVTAGTSQITVSPDTGYALSSVTVDPTPSETKTEGPNVSTNKEVTPTSGKLLSKVTITPQTHTGTYTPVANTAANDMGAYHDKRYVNTSGMIVPSGVKNINANGTGIDVKAYATVNVNVPNPTLSGDAATGNVLSGKTFYNSDYTKRTGTMTNNGAVSPTALSAGGSYTVPAGYHNGSGVVSAKTLASQTGVDSGKTAIDASHVHSGYQGWVNGTKVSGTYVEPTGTETLLWTNPSPTGTFSPQTITLSQSIRNFDYIKIRYLMSRAKTPLVYGTLLMPVDEFVTTADVDGALMIGITGRGGNFPLTRPTIYASDTSIQFLAANRVGGSSASTDVDIPQEIYGVTTPLRPTPGFIETTLWTNSAPTSNFSGDVTLSESISNFTYIAIDFRLSTSNTTSSRVIIPSADLLTYVGDYSIRGVLAMRTTSNAYRLFTCTSATVLDFQGAKNSSGTTVNNYCIPTYIKGLNFKS